MSKSKHTKRAKNKAKSVSVSQSSNPKKQSTVPQQNVLDLRSVVAQKEVESAKARRKRTQEEVKKRLAELDAQEKKSKRKNKTKRRKAVKAKKTKTPKVKAAKAPKPAKQNKVKPVKAEKKAKARAKEKAPNPRVAVSATAEEKQRTVWKPAVAFAALAVAFVLPASVSSVMGQANTIEQEVTASAQDAFVHLQQAADQVQQYEFDAAHGSFVEAQAAFDEAQSTIDEINGGLKVVAQYAPGEASKTFESGVHLVNAGEDLAAAGELLSQALAELHAADVGAFAADEERGLTPLLVLVHSAIDPAATYLDDAVDELEQVDAAVVPAEYRALIASAQQTLPTLADTVGEARDTTDILLTFLGHEEPRRYLVLNQNNYEKRATGGFIGSLVYMTIDKGAVTDFYSPPGGVYDVAGQFDQALIAPQPLWLVNPYWNIQDANWFPHFPASAKKVQWFSERTGQEPVDGVVTLVPSVIERLLEISGPIDMTEEYGVVIDSDNFYEEVQVRAEEKFDVTRESKKIIGDLIPQLFDQLFDAAEDPDQLFALLTTMRTSLLEKDVLAYMNDPQLQAEFSAHDWSGELKNTDRDYLGIFHSNIAGGKTDGDIEEVVKHTANITENEAGEYEIVNTVTITRSHKGPSQDELRGVKNQVFTRFYVPEGSTLVSAEGFDHPDHDTIMQPDASAIVDEDLAEISGELEFDPRTQTYSNDEFKKTVFGGWIFTPVGGSTTVTLEYKLPYTLTMGSIFDTTDRYSLLLQVQPGDFGTVYSSDVRLPESIEVVAPYPADYNGSFQDVLTTDKFVGMVIRRK